MTAPTTKAEALAAYAELLSDAYSTDRYAGGWAPTIKALRKRGHSDREVEAIIRSKWTRWAADSSGKPYGRATSADVLRFIDSGAGGISVAELTAETFPA